MSYPTPSQFGLILAYLIPGFVALAGTAPLVPSIAHWLAPVQDGAVGIGPTVYALLAALTASQLINCFRWVILDQVHYWTGLRPETSDFGQLKDTVQGFDYLVQNHYRYYQFAGNMLLAVCWSYGVNRFMATQPHLGPGTDLVILVIIVVLFAASRDALSKYYHRTHSLLGGTAEKASNVMYNGAGHHEGADAPKDPKQETHPELKSPAPAKPPTPKSPPRQPGK